MISMDKRPKLDWLNPDIFDFLNDSRILIIVLEIVFYQRQRELNNLLSRTGFIAALRTAVLVTNKRNKLLVHANNFHQVFASCKVYGALRGYLDLSQFATFKKFAKTPDNYQNQLIVLAKICRKFEQSPTDVGTQIKNFIFTSPAEETSSEDLSTIKTHEENDGFARQPSFLRRIIAGAKACMTCLLFSR